MNSERISERAKGEMGTAVIRETRAGLLAPSETPEYSLSEPATCPRSEAHFAGGSRLSGWTVIRAGSAAPEASPGQCPERGAGTWGRALQAEGRGGAKWGEAWKDRQTDIHSHHSSVGGMEERCRPSPSWH